MSEETTKRRDVKHDPTPWRVEKNLYGMANIIETDGRQIAACAAECPSSDLDADAAQDEANAAYIVECVNAHERLVAEVKRLRADNIWKNEVLGQVLQWLNNLVVADSIEGMDALVDNVRNAIGEEA